MAKEEKTEVKSRRKVNGREEKQKKLDLQNLFLCGNGRNK
jgi:hypothetical protein